MLVNYLTPEIPFSKRQMDEYAAACLELKTFIGR